LFPRIEGVGVGNGISLAVGLGVAVSAGAGVTDGDGDAPGLDVWDFFLCFDFVSGVGLANGAGEVFFFGETVGEGLGVAFVVERFRCFRDGVGVGDGPRTFLISVPNDSSAASGATIVPNKIAMLKKIRSVVLEAIGFVGRFCETPTSPASDTDALHFTPPRLIFMRRFLIAGSKISARVPGESLCLTEFRLQSSREENSR
jgi:hypothetical protein